MSKDTELLIDLGKKIVAELEYEESNDTLGRWMAHHIAELIIKAEKSVGEEQQRARRECFDAVLQLWEHRGELPDGRRPYQDLEPVIRAVESLDPENDYPRYFPSAWPRGRNVDEQSDQQKLIDNAKGVDHAAKSLISFMLKAAAEEALDQSAEWVEYARTAGEPGVPEIVVGFLKDDSVPANQLESRRKVLRDRVEMLRTFSESVELLATALETEAEELTATQTGPDSR